MLSGSSLIGLVLLSMAWLFYLLGLYLRIAILPGIVGSLAAFFSVGLLEAPWPWLWILLPLVLDPYWLGKLLRKR